MKKLEFNQMEFLEGGHCNGHDTFMNGLSGASVILTAAEVFAAATPFGWVCLGIGAVTFAYSIRNC